jgi:hypothetical protein
MLLLLLLLQVDSDARRILEAVGLKDPNAMVSAIGERNLLAADAFGMQPNPLARTGDEDLHILQLAMLSLAAQHVHARQVAVHSGAAVDAVPAVQAASCYAVLVHSRFSPIKLD